MAILDGRPVWALSGGEMLAQLDVLDAEIALLQTRRLEMIAGIDQLGYAKEIGAADTVQLLAFRHCLDAPPVRRDVKLANAPPKYALVSAALPDPAAPTSTDGSIQYGDPATGASHAGMGLPRRQPRRRRPVRQRQHPALPMAGRTALRTIRLGGNLLGRSVLASVAPTVADAAGTYDLITESIGGESLRAPVGKVTPGGTVVVLGTSSGEKTPIDIYDFLGHEGARPVSYLSYAEPGPVSADLQTW
jgi:hypothetical protein